MFLPTIVFVVAFFVTMFALMYVHSGGGEIRVPFVARPAVWSRKTPVRKDGSIFVSIASYRDAECSKTISSLFRNASRPDLVFVGTCQQNSKDDKIDCCDNLDERRDQIRIMRVDSEQARGPTYARYLCSLLWSGEQYFCQVDSHITFFKGWDDSCRTDMSKVPDKSILTHYPPSLGEQNVDGDVPEMNNFHDDGIMVTPRAESFHPPGDPVSQKFMAAGFFIAPSELLFDVPFDPNLPHLFAGEELLYSARCYCAGYDVFSPGRNIGQHFYERKEAPKFWNDIAQGRRQAGERVSLDKVRRLFQLKTTTEPHDIERYNDTFGFASERTLDQYWEFTGLTDVMNGKK